jgi:hypothetical protein
MPLKVSMKIAGKQVQTTHRQRSFDLQTLNSERIEHHDQILSELLRAGFVNPASGFDDGVD